MTVREVVKLLKNVETIAIGFGDRAIRIAPDDALMIGVYGSYVIDSIQFDKEVSEVELNVEMVPVKEGE